MKRKFISLSLVIALLFCISGCSKNDKKETSVKPIEKTTVSLAAGKLTGYLDDGIYNFKGIPYATANRFESPELVTKFENEEHISLTYGPVSPQDRALNGTGVVNDHEFMTPSNGTADMVANENCQNLNVWTKDLKGDKPVVVFFHGGGLNNGASSELSYYTGEYFVESQDAVFVSVNHRLNVLGYLDLSEFDNKYDNSGIAGMEDCVASLKWVKQNISKFGGNPNNVTIVGQSGGGLKVTTLACMSDTVDLFDKVVVLSGGMAAPEDNKASALENTNKLISYLNLSKDQVISTLTSMSYEELYNASVKAGCSWNTHYETGTFETPLFDKNDKINEYAAQRKWMIGTTFSEFASNGETLINSSDVKDNLNTDEKDVMKTLKEIYGENSDKIAEEFKKAYPSHDLSEILYINKIPVGGLSRSYIINNLLNKFNNSNVDVYNYIVSYKQPYFGGVTMHHTGDIPYWFNSIDEVEYMIKGDEDNAHNVASSMSSALASFINNGNPSTDKLKWMPYTTKDHNTMIFDVYSELKVDFDKKLYELINSSSIKK